MKLRFSNEWLKQKIEKEAEYLSVEAGFLDLTNDEFEVDFLKIALEYAVYEIKKLKAELKQKDEKLSELTHGIPIEKAKEGVIHLVEKKDQSVHIGWLDCFQSPATDWLTPDGDCIETSEIKRVFPTGLTFPTYAFPSQNSQTQEGS